MTDCGAKSARGVTMIELMIVLAVMGIVALTTVPNLEVWLHRMRLNGAASHLMVTVQNTRKMSITNQNRYCLTFTADAASLSNNDSSYLVGVAVSEEVGLDSGSWSTITEPVELAGWTNDATTELYKGVSLEDGSNTTTFAGTSNCLGLLFNNAGFLANPGTDFAHAVAGGKYALLTLRNKSRSPAEQRSIWIDRGGNVRITSGPTTPPTLGGP
ncbi:MAG: hypothetical protein CL928_14360 [Deltaproteobacteria bacterium]|nr:hypothetical protein [Deltaproteobacteria bacterium]